ncbi:hypothetical protein GGTG_03847 [Gaeumannomyces tritici R3-111a-1]|uniref:Uncharacterized protein n=1 Tax=Gaeumannomyces tritici (strain R3-111a-1) TaxID=644352 RepID=J3NRE3_GAET3|nr:hypothetical protein GGTG_03847 [Gaeumannomyces tritici R3-111a-1]EJT78749.1 hypothetical protein GGTG_03847 [Gaeumannomyces tritici R3-111a-1]
MIPVAPPNSLLNFDSILRDRAPRRLSTTTTLARTRIASSKYRPLISTHTDATFELKRADAIRCTECGCRVLYKNRTNRMIEFEAR